MRRPTVLPVLLATTLLLAACGGDDYPEAAPPSSAMSVAASAAAATSTAVASSEGTTSPGVTVTPDTVGSTATAPPVEPTASTGAIPREQLPLVEFVRGDGSVVKLPVEVLPRTEYSIGLSGRYSLDERGMLFYYDDPANRSGFWMKNTHIDLSLAFANGQGQIVAIELLYAESEQIVKPAPEYQYIIEAPAGWYAASGVEVGDTLRLTFALEDWLE